MKIDQAPLVVDTLARADEALKSFGTNTPGADFILTTSVDQIRYFGERRSSSLSIGFPNQDLLRVSVNHTATGIRRALLSWLGQSTDTGTILTYNRTENRASIWHNQPWQRGRNVIVDLTEDGSLQRALRQLPRGAVSDLEQINRCLPGEVSKAIVERDNRLR